MKKAISIIISAAVIAVVALIAVFVGVFYPKAKPIKMPPVCLITSVSISDENKALEISVENDDIERICSIISEAKPTRRRSFDDNSATRPYYRIEIFTSDFFYRYYLYEEGTEVFLEVPYEGIYESSEQAIQFVTDYCHKAGQ